MLKGHRSWVNRVAVDRRGRFVVTGSDDRTVRVWSLPHGKPVLIIEGDTAVTDVAVSPDSSRVAVAQGTVVRLYPVSLGWRHIDAAAALRQAELAAGLTLHRSSGELRQSR